MQKGDRFKAIFARAWFTVGVAGAAGGFLQCDGGGDDAAAPPSTPDAAAPGDASMPDDAASDTGRRPDSAGSATPPDAGGAAVDAGDSSAGPIPDADSGAAPEAGLYAFADEFNGTSIDTTRWAVMDQHGDVTNHETVCYAPANAAVAGGFLTETARAQAATCLNAQGNPAGPVGGMLDESFTSAALQMKSFSFLYGTVEVRAKFAGGTGTWPAIWMLGAYCQYPTWLSGVNSHGTNAANACKWHDPGSDEIDIAEIFSGAATVNETIQGDNGCQPSPPSGTPQEWHVYTLVWTAGSVTWSIDGTSECSLTQNVPALPMFLILNTSVGGAGGGTADPSTLPQTTTIDYVHVTTANVATP